MTLNPRRRVARLSTAALTLLLATGASLAGTSSAGAAPKPSPQGRAHGKGQAPPQLPSPLKPPQGKPVPRTFTTATTSPRLPTATPGTPALAVPNPPQAKTFGNPGSATTLVLYDSTNTYGWLGELYAIAGGTLATHFGQVTAEPAVNYVAGQVEGFTSTIYLGSTYNEPLPAAMLNDLRATSRPVLWSGYNIWQLSDAAGSAADAAFQARYGWDPATSYVDTTDTLSSVTYKGKQFTRSTLNQGGLLAPNVIDGTKVTTVASATCSDSAGNTVACTGTGSGAPQVPWAIRAANLTYVGEIPFSYISETDRYVAFADLLFAALAPQAIPTHKALVRLEDVNPTSDPATLNAFADYLSSLGVPFSVGVIPQYTDPNGTYNGGVPQTITLANRPAVVRALKYMQSKGGTLVQHGFTHQYAKLANPYNGVTGDDFEFYRAECSSTAAAPYSFHAPCLNTDWVILEGALPGDSTSSASTKVVTGRNRMVNAGLTAPTIFETPHYSASAVDYAAMRQTYPTRYERELFFGGLLRGGTLDTSKVFGQFFPYTVSDVYGAKIVPENLGNYEPVVSNNNPPRLPAQIVHNADVNLAVTQGVASFFFHPDYPLDQLKQIVPNIQALGYTFVAPTAAG